MGNLEAFIVFVHDCCDWFKCLNTKETTVLKQKTFLKPVFHQLINSPSENTTVSIWAKRVAAEQFNATGFI